MKFSGAHLFTSTQPLLILLGVGKRQKDDLLAILCRRQLETLFMTFQFDLFY